MATPNPDRQELQLQDMMRQLDKNASNFEAMARSSKDPIIAAEYYRAAKLSRESSKELQDLSFERFGKP